MIYTFTEDSPIYLQLAQLLKDDIFLGIYKEETAIPSTTELSVVLHINPATVLKAMNILLQEDLIEKKRGIGMFVKANAKKKITEERKNSFCSSYVAPLIKEAKKLSLSKDEIIEMINKEESNEAWL